MLGIELIKNGDQPLKKQIYATLREQILSGKLKASEALPSTRELAVDLGVSRNTVVEAYEMLIAEGFIKNRQGAPTRVSDGIALERPPHSPSRTKSPNACSSSSRPSSKSEKPILDFRTGKPDLRQFPRFLWRQALQRAAQEMPPEHYGYTGPQGLLSLREEIAAWLYRSRGLSVEPGDIFITAGATHALHLLTDILCEKSKKVIMEDPCHNGMMQVIVNRGCTVIPVPVDAHGMQTGLLPNLPDVCAVYVTPSHQFPLGGILPAPRRAELIRYASEKGIYILEDDYDSEFRYSGDPIAPLYAMNPHKVIYVGTFSKSLFPALRIGYVLLPEPLRRLWKERRTYMDVQNPLFDQAALSEFMGTRRLDHHVQKMRRLYGKRREALLNALVHAFKSDFTPFGDASGLHMAVEFKGKVFDDDFRKAGRQRGIYLTPVESYCIEKGRHRNKLLLGYGHLDPDEIQKNVEGLKQFIYSLKGS